MHVCQRLLQAGEEVIALDNLNDYYDVRLKEARLGLLASWPGFRFVRMDVADRDAMAEFFSREMPAHVVHLAAQAGVRYSLKNPHAYVDSNLVGFVNVLEGCRHAGVKHFVYASSSSVYGGNTRMPFSERDSVDHPVSLYAATKKANELMAHSYSHLYGLPTTGLRFFTVYGPWGRPDMAMFLFVRAILAGQPIDVFNHGQMQRDFTYIDDIAQGVTEILARPPIFDAAFDRMNPDPGRSWAPYRVCNIGHQQPVELMHCIRLLEQALGKTAKLNLLPMQEGDVPATFADVTRLCEISRFTPNVSIEEGVARFVRWYIDFYEEKS